jgi:hypothetical protein
VWAVVLKGRFFEFQRHTRLEHAYVVSSKRGGLFRWEYFIILFAFDLRLANVERLLELAVDEEVPALRILEKDQIRAAVQDLPGEHLLGPPWFTYVGFLAPGVVAPVVRVRLVPCVTSEPPVGRDTVVREHPARAASRPCKSSDARGVCISAACVERVFVVIRLAFEQRIGDGRQLVATSSPSVRVQDGICPDHALFHGAEVCAVEERAAISHYSPMSSVATTGGR